MEFDFENPAVWGITIIGTALCGWMYFKMSSINLMIKVFMTVVSAVVMFMIATWQVNK